MIKQRKATLRGQITSLTLCIIAFLFMLVGILQYTFMKDFLYNNKAELLQTQIRSWPPDPLFLSTFDHSKEWMPLGDRMPNRPIIFQPGMIVSIISADGKQSILSEHEKDALPQISVQQYDDIFQQYHSGEQQRYYLFADEAGNDYMVLFREISDRAGTGSMLQVSVEVDSLQRQLHTQLAIYSAIALFALIAGSIFMLLSLRKALRPLHNMIDAVERTNAENLTEQLPVMQQQELKQLADAYNNMLIRLEAAFESERMSSERMRQFIADASHELRTPVTSIYGFIEVLRRGAMNNSKQLELSLKAMEQESLRMKSLVESLLQLAKLDHSYAEQLIHDMQPLALQPLIKEMLLQLELMAGKREVKLNMDPAETSRILANRHSIQQIILNLISNAIQHTDPERGIIAISVKQTEDKLLLKVSDNGVGIAKEHQQQLFERFFRIDKARTRAGGGAGLGLSITKAIVEKHGAQISVESDIGLGSTFTITFPLLEEEALKA